MALRKAGTGSVARLAELRRSVMADRTKKTVLERSTPAPPLDDIDVMTFVERDRPLDDPAYTHELKFDGYRLLAETGAAVRLKTRNGADATRWFPEIVAGLDDFTARHVFDGEVCVLDELGRPDFDRLHRRAKARGYRPGLDPVVYCVFDLLVHRGRDIRARPLSERKSALARLLRRKRSSILRVDDFPGRGVWLFEPARALELEGIVSKRLDSLYLSGQRSDAWQKVKRPGAVPPERFRR